MTSGSERDGLNEIVRYFLADASGAQISVEFDTWSDAHRAFEQSEDPAVVTVQMVTYARVEQVTAWWPPA